MAERQTLKSVFKTLNGINVNDHVETKDTGNAKLTYLSWSWAWAETKKAYPDATYEIVKFGNGIPYAYDPLTGYMVYTKVTIEGITHEMWLPVMDSQNRAMKAEPYQIQTKYKTITVQPATMTDINKTIMRCLVKNLAMFGLGLYIYAGEDLPSGDDVPQADPPQPAYPPIPAPAQPAPPPKEEQQEVCVCAKCLNIIRDTAKYKASRIVKESRERFNGITYCYNCMREVNEEQKKAQQEAGELPFPLEVN